MKFNTKFLLRRSFKLYIRVETKLLVKKEYNFFFFFFSFTIHSNQSKTEANIIRLFIDEFRIK